MKTHFRTAVNIFLVIAVFYGWLSLVFGAGGALADTGIRSLRYFTVLSNLLEAAASVMWLISARKNGTASGAAEKLKYVAAAAVMLTFTVVMTFLGPIYGYPMMLEGGNLYLHLIVPLAAAAEMVFLEDRQFSRRDNDITVIPPLIYGIFYLGNIIINGRGEWPDTNDWYMFTAWGYPVTALIYVVIIIVTWLLGLFLRKVRIGEKTNG